MAQNPEIRIRTTKANLARVKRAAKQEGMKINAFCWRLIANEVNQILNKSLPIYRSEQ